jgi:hypothetical protein
MSSPAFNEGLATRLRELFPVLSLLPLLLGLVFWGQLAAGVYENLAVARQLAGGDGLDDLVGADGEERENISPLFIIPLAPASMLGLNLSDIAVIQSSLGWAAVGMAAMAL